MADVAIDRVSTYRKRAEILRTLADGMEHSGGNGDLLRRLSVEYDRMAANERERAATEQIAAESAQKRNLPRAS